MGFAASAGSVSLWVSLPICGSVERSIPLAAVLPPAVAASCRRWIHVRKDRIGRSRVTDRSRTALPCGLVEARAQSRPRDQMARAGEPGHGRADLGDEYPGDSVTDHR